MNIASIKLDVNFLCGSTSGTYEDIDKVRNINVAYQDVARLIWTSARGWQYDDSNATTLPIAKTNLVHNQQDYSLPSTAQRLERVQVKDSGGHWHKLEPIDLKDILTSTELQFPSPGMPKYYDPMGASILLYPTPSSASVTLSAGLQVFISRNVTEFAVSATTTEPGFATPFHRILSYAAAIDFTQDPTQRQFLALQKDRLEKGMVTFYSERGAEFKNVITPHSKRRWRTYQ